MYQRWFAVALLFLFTSLAFAQDDYRLGPEDVVRVTIAGYDQISVPKATVSSLGTITLPILEDIKVQGLTQSEVETLISRILAQYIKGSPKVQVSILEANSRKVRVLGAVNVPGEYKISPGATLIDALTSAGDTSDEADIRAIQVISADGTKQTVDLRNYFRTGDENTIPLLKANDTIRVPKRRSLSDTSTVFGMGDTGEVLINVWGSVPKPGQLVFYGNPTLIDVLTLAGGVGDELALRKIRVVRGDPYTGGQITVDVQKFIDTGDYDLLPVLQSGDSIFVPEVPRVEQIKQREVVVMGEVNKPGSYPVDGPIPLADTLALAGGFTRDADPAKVRISREQDGILRHQDVDARHLLSGYTLAEESTVLPLIRPGDTIVVSPKGSGLLSAANVSRGLIAFFVDMVALYGLYQALTR